MRVTMINVTIVRLEDNSREVYYVSLPEQEKLTAAVAKQAVELAGLVDGIVYWGDVAYKVTGRTVKKIPAEK
jgi:hypothetical protein